MDYIETSLESQRTYAILRHVMSTHFQHTDKSFSETLREIVQTMAAEGSTLHELLEKLGERGLLMFCMILTIPFLFPVSIPGTSAPFGLMIAFIGVGLIVDRPPWLPDRFMNRRFPREQLGPLLEEGARQ